MNILSYIHIHRLPNPSGVGRVIDRLLTNHARLFPETRHRMLVDRKLYNKCYRDLSDHWKMEFFVPHRLGTSWQQAAWLLPGRPLAEHYWEDVELVYCPAESYVPTRKAKLVCTIHDVAGFETDLYPNTRNARTHRLKWSMLFHQMAEHADAVVTVSGFSASRIAHFFPALASKLHVIYNAPHSIFGSETNDELEKQVDEIAGGKRFVLVPGGLSLRKNAKLIVNALPEFTRRLPDVRLIIAGSNDAPYVEGVRATPQADVIMPGYVSDALLNALYGRAAVVWFPSRYEGFGMPVIEAMAVGAPVVASHVASIPEVADGAALLCDMDNPLEHVDALRSIIESNALRSELCSKSLAQAKKFTWTVSAHQLQTLFQSL